MAGARPPDFPFRYRWQLAVERTGMTVRELADELGVSKSALYYAMHSPRPKSPHTHLVPRLAELADVPEWWLRGDDLDQPVRAGSSRHSPVACSTLMLMACWPAGGECAPARRSSCRHTSRRRR